MIFKRIYSVLISLFFCFASSNAQQLKFLGVPLCSDLSHYGNVLKNKRFKDKYSSGPLAHRYWEGGDFWKISQCYVQLFTSASSADVNMKNKVTSITINLPFPYFDIDLETYKTMLSDLINDYVEIYGKNIINEKRNNYETMKDDLIAHIWKLPDGQVEMVVNWNAVWGVEITYTSAYILEKRKAAAQFKGAGKNDL